MGDPRVSSYPYRLKTLIDAGLLREDFMERLAKQEPVLTLGGRPDVEKVARGEQPLAVLNYQSDAAPFAESGAPIKAIAMKEGTPMTCLLISAIEGGPHPNTMRLFINWLLSEEGQNYTAKYVGPAVRKGILQSYPESIRLEPANPFVTPNEIQLKMDQAFRDKTLVPMFTK